MSERDITGVGTKFYRWNPASSGGGWEPISRITNIGGPNATRETHDTTALDTEGGYRTFIAGFRDGGTMVLSMNFTRTGYELLKGDFESDIPANFKMVLPDDVETTFEFEGLVTEIPLNVPPGIVTVEVTIKISGPTDLYDGSSGE